MEGREIKGEMSFTFFLQQKVEKYRLRGLKTFSIYGLVCLHDQIYYVFVYSTETVSVTTHMF